MDTVLQVKVTDIVLGVMSLIAAIAAVISAIPTVKDWLPPKLEKKEKDILLLAIDDSFPNTICFVCGAGKAYVQTPYKNHSNIPVESEISTLVSKGLLIHIDSELIQGLLNYKVNWLMLTGKGIRAAKRIHSKAQS
ncbi:conserved hypothetical protein [Vibrio jasicida]|uniref:hypothetical protein n=1 Tax=Vibrio jasicida TaxID=766224 RepID=UPI00289456D8|nr:conserved hypothetical protein [Vibrio jasicida]CAH1607147.1 conserved hypothetical protein [Vibrio jasicida]